MGKVTVNGKNYTLISTQLDDMVDGAWKKVCRAVCEEETVPVEQLFDKETDRRNYNIFRSHDFFKIVYIVYEDGKPDRVANVPVTFIMDTDLEKAKKEMEKIKKEEKQENKELLPEYTREKVLEEFKVMCVDFWGEKKTKKAIKEAWVDNLTVMKEDGYNVDKGWKLTKEEVEELMRI